MLAPRLDRDAQGADWVRALEARGAWVQIWPVDGARLVGWLRSRGAQARTGLSEEALELLAARTEGNLLAAHQELTKLTLLGGAAGVTAEAVLASVADSARFDVFQLGEAVLAGETPRALRMLAGLRAEGTEPTLALWALTKAVRDVWNAQAGGGGARPGLAAPGRRRWRRRSAARRACPSRDLARARRAADRMIKGRLSGDAWDELALLAADLCAQPLLRCRRLRPEGR